MRHEGTRLGHRYSSTLSSTLTPDAVGDQCHAPAASLLVSIVHVDGWDLEPSRQVQKISSPPGFELQTDQPTGMHYTDHITLTAVKTEHTLYESC